VYVAFIGSGAVAARERAFIRWRGPAWVRRARLAWDDTPCIHDSMRSKQNVRRTCTMPNSPTVLLSQDSRNKRHPSVGHVMQYANQKNFPGLPCPLRCRRMLHFPVCTTVGTQDWRRIRIRGGVAGCQGR